MQKVTVLCVGKLKEKFYIDAAAEYAKRLSRFCKLELQRMILCQLIQKFCVKGLHETHIHKGDFFSPVSQCLPDTFPGLHHTSHCQKGYSSASGNHFSLSPDNGSPEFFQSIISLPAGITDRHRSLFVNGKLHHIRQFPEIFRRHQSHIRYHGEIAQIKTAIVRLSVTSHKACPVNGKNHMEFLHAHIMEHLIYPSLQERRIDCKDGNHSSQRQACRKSHSMFLRDSHIKEPVRKHICKSF